MKLEEWNLDLKRILFVTGRPGIGKTTVLLRTVKCLRAKGFRVGGMLSREARKAGSRVGFEILDLATGRKGWLAHINQPVGPRIGKYRVSLEDLDSIGVKAILEALEKADVVAIDEIGPMELCSQAFVKAVRRVLESSKPVTGTVHFRARHHLVNYLKGRDDSEVFEATLKNRDELHKLITQKLLIVLREK
jgi:nucleoside-triphosphatase